MSYLPSVTNISLYSKATCSAKASSNKPFSDVGQISYVFRLVFKYKLQNYSQLDRGLINMFDDVLGINCSTKFTITTNFYSQGCEHYEVDADYNSVRRSTYYIYRRGIIFPI